VAVGLRTTITPSATPLLSEEAVERIHACGVSRMAVSLDGPDEASHDDFRQVAGSFARTIGALRHAARIGLETQINTTVTRYNRHRLDEIAALVERQKARLWSVFFLIVTGRAEAQYDLSPEEYEEVFDLLYRTSLRAPFDIKTTEAQHYRRYVARQVKSLPASRGARPASPMSAIARQAGINAGKGFLFVSHTGEIYPSGFLEISAGNVRHTSLADAYRYSDLFRALRDSSRLEGKCGACEFRNLCGGSRSRAYALTGNFLAADPRCVYQPGEAAHTAQP
jgi:radical SAM protein with 4Fe4S-binding SPASM domain